LVKTLHGLAALRFENTGVNLRGFDGRMAKLLLDEAVVVPAGFQQESGVGVP